MIYSLIIRFRHLFYDKGWIKSSPVGVPSVCVGNLSLGGSGKTPMTELIVRLLSDGKTEVEKTEKEKYEEADFGGLFDGIGLFDGHSFGGEMTEGCKPRSLAVLSRGYRRKSKGFQLVPSDGTSILYGDEPMQIKRKFPDVTVAVDKDRVHGCSMLKDADFIVLDDAFQHRRIRASKNILLTSYFRPYFEDRVLPWGRLRDLPSRALEADALILTKCPVMLYDEDKTEWAHRFGLDDFDPCTCIGTNARGRRQYLFFAQTRYDRFQPLFPEGDSHYLYSKSLILVSGIADDVPMVRHLEKEYRITDHISFPDHHFFTDADIAGISKSADLNCTSIVLTTEKDAQRIRDLPSSDIPENLKKRMFYAPIKTQLMSQYEQDIFKKFLTCETK